MTTRSYKLTEDIEEALERDGASCELLAGWAARERKALAAPKGAGGHALPRDARKAAVKCIGFLAKPMELPENAGLKAAILLDMYCMRAPGGLNVEELPAVCAAVLRLLLKMEDALRGMREVNFVPHATRLAQIFRHMGIPVGEATGEQIAAQERALLTTLQWQINLPTVSCWLTLFLKRFNTITQRKYEASITWITATSTWWCSCVVTNEVTTEKLPPRSIATGFLGIFFAMAFLLPWEALRPADFSVEAWAHLYQQVLANGKDPTCHLESEHAQQVLQQLLTSANLTFEELQAGCSLTAGLLQQAHTKCTR
mmetsp:Transcript_3818/g.12173  ORF Transcript_3818/g.12173 Transcript_3818/m.12173 type:complete len:313 (-) Transcript_3818:58-996(-)